MKNYEAMFILKPDLSKDKNENLFEQIKQIFAKHETDVKNASVWAEKKKLCFPIKKNNEGTYYLVNFSSVPSEIAKMNRDYKLNENILRVLFTCIE